MSNDYKKELEELLSEVIKLDATDLHISSGRAPMVRIDGKLREIEKIKTLDREHAKNLSLALLTEDQEKKFWEKKDLDFSFSFEDRARFRVNIFQESNNIGAALRFVPTKVRTIEELNLPPIMHEFTKQNQGFFLVVGPSGQGKTTALAALIDEINHQRQDHILTIEDPVEYLFEQDKCIVDQREIGTDCVDFHQGLRAMFREDVDVCMIGEMRDPETISTAITAAETGHLIFSTLHTNNAAQTIDRVIDTFPPYQQTQIRMQLASSLLGILSRRLMPLADGGLINAVELLIVNSAVRNLIREGKIHQIDMVIDTSSGEGMISLNRSLAGLVREGKVNLKDAENCSTNPEELKLLLKEKD